MVELVILKNKAYLASKQVFFHVLFTNKKLRMSCTSQNPNITTKVSVNSSGELIKYVHKFSAVSNQPLTIYSDTDMFDTGDSLIKLLEITNPFNCIMSSADCRDVPFRKKIYLQKFIEMQTFIKINFFFIELGYIFLLSNVSFFNI